MQKLIEITGLNADGSDVYTMSALALPEVIVDVLWGRVDPHRHRGVRTMPDGWDGFFAALDASGRDQVLTELVFGMAPMWCMARPRLRAGGWSTLTEDGEVLISA